MATESYTTTWDLTSFDQSCNTKTTRYSRASHGLEQRSDHRPETSVQAQTPVGHQGLARAGQPANRTLGLHEGRL